MIPIFLAGPWTSKPSCCAQKLKPASCSIKLNYRYIILHFLAWIHLQAIFACGMGVMEEWSVMEDWSVIFLHGFSTGISRRFGSDIKTLIIWSDGFGYKKTGMQLFRMLFFTWLKRCRWQSYISFSFQATLIWTATQSIVSLREKSPEQCTLQGTMLCWMCSRLLGIIMLNSWNSATAWVDFHEAYLSSICPGKKNRWIQSSIIFAPCATLSTKLTLTSSSRPSHNASRPPVTSHWNKCMYTGRLPITQRNYNDLKALMHVVPQDMHPFYDNLPLK